MTQQNILVVEDDESLREAVSEALSLAGYSPLEASDGQSGLAALGQHEIAMIVTDVQMRPMNGHTFLERIKESHPNLPVLVMTAFGTIEGAVRAMRAGAVDYLPKPFEGRELIKRVTGTLAPKRTAEDHGFLAVAPESQTVLQLARQVAASDATVLITGESGTGKEVLARFIHQASRHGHGPFVAINCAAIPDNLLEATLFGYEKGAFTGAHRAHPGKMEQAENGTLLLDEISEMDLTLQAKILRVLQEREVERLGSHKTTTLNMRVLATSNRDLRAAVKAGQFREDLYYRLSVFPLRIPPLRQRPEDILPLARHLLELLAAEEERPTPKLSNKAARQLLRHPWPGNVRELNNVVQRALILQQGSVIEVENLCFDLDTESRAPTLPCDDLRASEQKKILETLEDVTGNREAAARRLGISPRTLRYKLARMRKAGISVPGDSLDQRFASSEK